MSNLLAIDQGTTSSRSILFGPDGTPRHTAKQEFRQHFPHPGWVEHDAEEIWQTQLATAQRVLAESGIGADRVGAVGITNQRETTVVWERATGRPLHRAIVWQDRRVADRTDRMRARRAKRRTRGRGGASARRKASIRAARCSTGPCGTSSA